jgi:hypothetical protein
LSEAKIIVRAFRFERRFAADHSPFRAIDQEARRRPWRAGGRIVGGRPPTGAQESFARNGLRATF